MSAQQFEVSQSYSDWADSHDSQIHGHGYASDHHWHHEWTSPSGTSYYKCARCYVNLGHHYRSEPDIFKALKKSGVPDKCARVPVQPLRPEYAKKEVA